MMTSQLHSSPAGRAPQFIRPAPAKRTGAVALMLVLVLSMLVGTFAIALNSRAAQQRNAEYHEHSIVLLESAIDSVAQANLSEENNVRLPVDEAAGRWIEVELISEAGDEPSEYRATQYKDDQPGLSIQRNTR